jgi:multidrug transporter EmrE-like cation transporter
MHLLSDTKAMADIYWLGVLFGLLTGTFDNLGAVFQKKAINALPEGKKVTRGLLKNRLWLFGFFQTQVLTTIFFFVAQLMIGPTLTPALSGAGLIILAVGSLRILKERIRATEMLGIFLMVAAIFCVAFSRLDIDVDSLLFLSETTFIIRVVVFTAIVTVGAVICTILRRSRQNIKGTLYATDSGLMFALSNFWTAVFLGVFATVFSGTFVIGELFLFVCGAIMLPLSNYLGIFKMQKAYEVGNASKMKPTQQVPVQIAPIFYFFAIYMLPDPTGYSFSLDLIGIVLILASMYLLLRRQAILGKKKLFRPTG